jgi:hypothetical protein
VHVLAPCVCYVVTRARVCVGLFFVFCPGRACTRQDDDGATVKAGDIGESAGAAGAGAASAP